MKTRLSILFFSFFGVIALHFAHAQKSAEIATPPPIPTPEPLATPRFDFSLAPTSPASPTPARKKSSRRDKAQSSPTPEDGGSSPAPTINEESIIRPPSLTNENAKKQPTPDDDAVVRKADALIRSARARCAGNKSLAENEKQQAISQGILSSDTKRKIANQSANVAQQINLAISTDMTISAQAREVRAVLNEGVIVLRGVVNSVEEKVFVESKAMTIAAGKAKVVSEVTIKKPE